MALVRVNWGGGIYDSTSAGSQLEIWSNTLHMVTPSSPDVETLGTVISGMLTPWFSSIDTHISATVRLEFLKVNEIDAMTGLQITDPTNEISYLASNVRGGAAVDESTEVPFTQALRVSMDNATRNPRARGGFFIPRPAIYSRHDGRWAATPFAQVANQTNVFLQDLQDMTDIVGLAVYSRVDHGAFGVTRVRYGNVPDNIRSRKNNLVVGYTEYTLT